MHRNILFVVFIGSIIFSGCHEVDKVLVPIERTTEELNTTTSNLTIPVLDELPYADVHFRRNKIIMEKHF